MPSQPLSCNWNGAPDRYSVRAVDRALGILLAFTCARPDYTLSELATEVGLEKATVHRLVRTLESRNFIERRPDGRYGLGNILPTLGMIVIESWELRDIVAPTLAELVQRTEETAFCSILHGWQVLTVASSPGQQRLRLAIVPGERAPAAITADGKVLLASLPPEQALRRVVGKSDAYPGRSKPWLRPWLANLARVRQEGVAYDLAENTTDLNTVAVPLRDYRGEVIAAIAITAPASRLAQNRIPEMVNILKRVTAMCTPPLGDGVRVNPPRLVA
jgi:DNA-binding IclR family transcriptional regulator